MNYLEDKIKNDKKGKKSNKGATKGSRHSKKPATKTFVDDESYLDSKTRRRNSSPKMTKSSSFRDGAELDDIRPKTRIRRGSDQPGGRISPRPQSNKKASKTNLVEVPEEENLGSDRSITRQMKVNKDDKHTEENKEQEEDSNINDNDNETPQTKEKQVNDKELLVQLMKKNIKLTESSASDETALYEAYDLLMEEYQRRRAQRRKVGGLLKRKVNQIKNLLGEARRPQSDLELKARSQDLQKSKSRGRRRIVDYNDPDKI